MFWCSNFSDKSEIFENRGPVLKTHTYSENADT